MSRLAEPARGVPGAQKAPGAQKGPGAEKVLGAEKVHGAQKIDVRRLHAALCSPFVDETYYRAALRGGRADLGTVMRYATTAVGQRPLLTPYLDPDWYRAVANLSPDTDPLLHFIEQGAAEGLSPHPLIEFGYIDAQDRTLLGDPPSAASLARVLDEDLADPSPYFDRAFYAAGLPEAVRGLLRHFLRHGLGEGMRPNRWLDPAWYAAQHADVSRDRYAALRDFIVRGDPSGRAPGPAFDGKQYWRRYTDVADAGIPPLRHYLAHGRHENRQVPIDRTARTVATSAAVSPAAAQLATSRRAGEALPIDPAAALAARASFDEALRAAWQARKDAVEATRPPLIVCDNPEAMARHLVLPRSDAPVVSVLIPAFNEAAHTIACLTALAEAPPAIACEIVLGDDASSDAALRLLGEAQGLIVVRQKRNVGFIRNCNAAFARCRGDFVLLLNNDAQMLPGAIDALASALLADPTLGAVGPKILYPDGRLQEAGCFLRPNGESGMVGLFMDPEDPAFCHDRDVAYCSGAALMLRRAAVGETLFDEAYLPAYCEDADLCLRLQRDGHRVRYISDAIVVHHLSASSDPTREAIRRRGIVRNQATLQARWGDDLNRMDRVRVLAFYLPQFHPTPQNDLWWGKGFTEWTNVARAQPSFIGHYQPHLPADLGFYDLRLPDSLRAQAALAARYGVEGFCLYHYDFGTARLLDTPLQVLQRHPDIPFHHCLCWANENWTKHWDGGEREILVEQSYDDATLQRIADDVARHAGDPRYLRVEGMPLFLVYRPLLLPDPGGFASLCRDRFARAGLPGVHLVYVESMEAVDRGLSPQDIGFDAAVEFPPHGRAVPSDSAVDVLKEGFSGYRYDYARTAAAFIERPGVSYRRYPTVFPSWDNTPRQPLRGTSFENGDPLLFGAYVEAKIEAIRGHLMGDARLLFVNAWNEWAEGAHLEPDSGYGHRWLEALSDAVDGRRWQ